MKARFEHIPPGQADPDPLPGDFILTHGGEFFSRVIQLAQGLRFTGKDQPYTYWNHSALIVSADGALIEALGPGIQRNTLAAYEGTQYTVVHIDASDEDRKEMVAFAEHWVSRNGQYGWATIVSITLSLLTGLKLSFGFPGTADLQWTDRARARAHDRDLRPGTVARDAGGTREDVRRRPAATRYAQRQAGALLMNLVAKS